jgi:hypothetical protein
MDYETLEHQVDTLSQAVELLLQHTEAQVPLEQRRILQILRDELFTLRTERVGLGHDMTPESLHPPFENARPAENGEADEKSSRTEG